jgi:ribosomal protein S27E
MSSKNISDVFCPSCGSAAHFDIVHQNYKCSYCDGRVEIRDAIKEKQGFRELHQKKIKEDAKKYKLLSGYCSGCGATVVFEENEPMATCAFCGKALVRKEYTSDKELPELLIPFRITEDEAKKIAKEWCEANKNKEEAKHFSERISNIKGFYLPYELIRGCVRCSNVGRKDAYARFDCRGDVAQEFINRSKQLDNLLLDAMEPFELDDLKEFDFAYLAGQRVKVSDIDNYELEKRICDELEENYKKELKKTFKTDALDISVATESMLRMPVLLPVYYICDGNFMAVINGQTGKVSVRAEKDSYYYFLPWWLKAILSNIIICSIIYLVMVICGAKKDVALTALGCLAVIIGIVTLCLFEQDSKKKAFKELAGRKIFSSKNYPYRRKETGELFKDQTELKREMNAPVFFQNYLGEEKPVEYDFASIKRLFPMYLTGFVVLFLPVICALLINGFDFQKLTLGGSAVWFCIFVPTVPIYLLKYAYVTLYNSPWIYVINEDGSKKRLDTGGFSFSKLFQNIKLLFSKNTDEDSFSSSEVFSNFKALVTKEPALGCFFIGFTLFIFVMNVYLTAFGFGDENENKKNNFKKGQIVTEKELGKSNNSTNSATASKPEIELLPLKQNNIYVYLLSTKEYFNFGVGKNNGYYSITHFTPEKKYDWFLFTNNIDEKRRIYSSGKKGEKGSQKLVYIDVNDTGFDVRNLENKLLWSIEKKDSDYYLKKGPDKEFAYKFVKFKQKSSNVLDCYMMLDTNNKAKSISWKTENGLYVFDENKKEKFYIPKCNPNSQNEPALAFPNIYLLEELNIKLRNIIAIEMSQLE